jgi:hypothetical protein
MGAPCILCVTLDQLLHPQCRVARAMGVILLGKRSTRP